MKYDEMMMISWKCHIISPRHAACHLVDLFPMAMSQQAHAHTLLQQLRDTTFHSN